MVTAGSFPPESEATYWWLISRRDGSRRSVVAWGEGGPLGWAADSRHFYWRAGDDVYRWPVDGGDRELLLTLPSGLTQCKPRTGVNDPEFVCAVNESHVDLYLVENFDPAA